MAYISTAERIGIEKGMAQGLMQGLQNVLSKGLEKLQHLVLSLLEQKFNSIPEAYKQKIFHSTKMELMQ